jgi:glycosyltransferase involved in cell wall biosynthesis
VRRLLLVSHRPIEGGGGAVARWRSFVRYLPEAGWEVTAVSPKEIEPMEFSQDEGDQRRFGRRARRMAVLRRLASPVLGVLGLRPSAVTPSTVWSFAGAREIRRSLASGSYDVVLATGPPIAALIAARLALRQHPVPFVAELRDLWAGNPAYDSGSRLLARIERSILDRARAVVVCTPEAAEDVRRRHGQVAGRLVEIPNGFDPRLLDLAERGTELEDRGANWDLTILHSGTLTEDRSLAPLLRVLAHEPYRSSFRFVQHGPVAPSIAAEVEHDGAGLSVEMLPASGWEDAVRRIAEADACLVTQPRSVGDETAVAAKVYEYLALGRPVLCISDGGATEALLERLGASQFCARLEDASSIRQALDRLRKGDIPPTPPSAALMPYNRRTQALQIAEVLDAVASDVFPTSPAELTS